MKNAKKNSGRGGADNKENTCMLEEFFYGQLKDIYYAEQQLVKAIPEMQKAATTEELKDAFKEHLGQTERHVKRLERIFQLAGQKAEGKRCDAIEGLIKEAKGIISETKEGTMTRDAALIIAAQKIEHYEIATYGGLVQIAVTMGFHRAAELLDKSLTEEALTDKGLTRIAERSINMEAENEGVSWSWKQQHEEVAEEV